MPRKLDARIEKAREMYLAGSKLIDIAKELGAPEGTVRSWKNRYEWDCNVAKKNRNVADNTKRRKKAVADEVETVMRNEELSDKQQLFCIYYIRCFNATKAYQKAYGCSYNSAMQNGCKLLRNAKVKEEIRKLKQEKLNREFLSESDIFQKYIDIAFADLTDYVEFGQEDVSVMGAFGPVKVEDESTGKKKAITKRVNVVRFKKSDEVDGTIIAEVKQGKDGASIKLADRMKALQWLSDHMDMATIEQKMQMEKLRGIGDGSDCDVMDDVHVDIYLPEKESDDG